MRVLVKKNLIGLSVETKLGFFVGKVIDVEIDPEAHVIELYHVKTSTLLPGFISKQILISRSQVVSITEDKMIVEDTVIKEKDPSLLRAVSPSVEG